MEFNELCIHTKIFSNVTPALVDHIRALVDAVRSRILHRATEKLSRSLLILKKEKKLVGIVCTQRAGARVG
jgi:hypothetical protein